MTSPATKELRMTHLAEALKKGHLEVVKKLLARDDIDVSMLNAEQTATVNELRAARISSETCDVFVRVIACVLPLLYISINVFMEIDI